MSPGLGRTPGEREWLPTPVFLPGEVHGQKSLAGYSPRGCKESDATEQLTHILGLCCKAKIRGFQEDSIVDKLSRSHVYCKVISLQLIKINGKKKKKSTVLEL